MQKCIIKRKNEERRVQLAIVSNPYVKEPNLLWEQFKDKDTEKVDSGFHPEDFEQFKSSIASTSLLAVK